LSPAQETQSFRFRLYQRLRSSPSIFSSTNFDPEIWNKFKGKPFVGKTAKNLTILQIHWKLFNIFTLDQIFILYHEVYILSNLYTTKTQIVVVVGMSWLFRGHLCCKSPICDLKMVAIRRWSLPQILLFIIYL